MKKIRAIISDGLDKIENEISDYLTDIVEDMDVMIKNFEHDEMDEAEFILELKKLKNSIEKHNFEL